MERRGEFGQRSPEYAKTDLMEYIEKLERVRERVNEIQAASVGERADAVREKIRQEGINMLTMREVLRTLDETGFEAFSAAEINRLVSIIDYIILEVDPAFKQFYKVLKQRLTGIAQIKLDFERMQASEEQQKREERRNR